MSIVSNEGSNYISVIDVLASRILVSIQVKDGPTCMGLIYKEVNYMFHVKEVR